jgi:hypothetical protein
MMKLSLLLLLLSLELLFFITYYTRVVVASTIQKFHVDKIISLQYVCTLHDERLDCRLVAYTGKCTGESSYYFFVLLLVLTFDLIHSLYSIQCSHFSYSVITRALYCTFSKFEHHQPSLNQLGLYVHGRPRTVYSRLPLSMYVPHTT